VGKDEQRLIEELQAELAKLTVSDLLLQTLHSISLLGYDRLTGENRDLAQARLAIEALRALVPVLEGTAPDEALRDFKPGAGEPSARICLGCGGRAERLKPSR
jgi:hypothetical protein